MAEIHVQRKEHAVWPWVLLGIVVVGLLIWWLVARDKDVPGTSYGAIGDTAAVAAAPGATAAPSVGATTGVGTTAASTAGFLAYADSAHARSAMGLDHVFTADGIRQLAAALGALTPDNSANGQTIRTQLDSARTLADALERDSSSTRHARYAHEAFMMEANTMSSIQRERTSSAKSQVDAVRSAAEAVSPQQLLLEQRSAVQQFFDRAATAVRAMSNGSSS